MSPMVLSFVALTLITLLLLVLPLLRRAEGSVVRADFDMQVYRDQLRELDRDLERGVLTPDQAEAARVEIQRRLLAADSEARAAARQAETAGRGRRLRIGMTLAVAVLLPVAAFGIYGTLGSPHLADRPHAERMAELLGLTPDQARTLRTSAQTLTARLAQTPGDQAGWLSLGRTWQSLGDYTKALTAYERASTLGPLDADGWASLGEANVLASNGQVLPGARDAFLKAVQVDRTDPRSRYYLGLAAVQGGDAPRGLAIWRDLSQTSAPDAPWMKMLRSRIAQVAQDAGLPPMTVSPRHPLDTRPVDIAKAPASGSPAAGSPAGDAAAAQADQDRQGGGFSPEEQAMVGSMIQRLKDRLAASPNDPEGWARLGKSLSVIRDYPGAVDAYAKAVAQDTANGSLRLDYGLALLTHAEASRAESLPAAFYEQADWMAKNAPDEPGGVYLRALAAESRSQTAEARTLWGKLVQIMPADSPAHTAAQERLKALGGS